MSFCAPFLLKMAYFHPIISTVMKLSASIIYYYLKTKYPFIHTAGVLSDSGILRYAVPYRKGDVIEKGIIYVTDDADIAIGSSLIDSTLFIYTGDPSCLVDSHFNSRRNFCYCDSITDTASILGFIATIFSRYHQWEDDIFEQFIRESPMSEFFALLDEVIPNPMMLIRMDFQVIAQKKCDFGELSDNYLGTSPETEPLVNSLKHDENYAACFPKDGCFYYPGNDTALPSLCVNIKKKGETLYRLIMCPGEMPLDPAFHFLLEYIARLLGMIIADREDTYNSSASSMHQTFSTILTDPKADEVRISSLLSQKGWLSSHTYLCAVLQTKASDWETQTFRTISYYVENNVPSSCAVVHRNNIVIFIDMDLTPLTISEIEMVLNGYALRNSLDIGYSRQLLGHLNFHRQYTQAKLTIRENKARHPEEYIHRFNAIALDYMLDKTMSTLPDYMICHEKLLDLMYEDQEKGSNLFETLRCFLENQQSVTKTANALFLHRSSLLYRLDKIKDFLGSDLSDPREILYLLLSFAILDQRK